MFNGCRSLSSIEIPDSVTSIGDRAFEDCSSMSRIEIPASVTGIGGYTFYNCIGLTSVIIPNSVTSIGEYAFYNCSSLTGIIIPDRVTSIGRSAFSHCKKLKTVELSEIEIIGMTLFYNCCSLESIVIPASVTDIYSDAFCNCYSLTDVYYTGSGMEWMNVSISSGNEYLSGANIYFDYVISDRYTIYYYTCGANESIDTVVLPVGTAAQISSVIPTRGGYRFMGWALSSNSDEAVYNPGDEYAGEKSISLYAVWTKLPSMQVQTKKYDSYTIYIAELSDVTGTCFINFAKYKNGRFAGTEIREYKGESEIFASFEGEEQVKFMVWQDMNGITPLTAAQPASAGELTK